MTKNGNDIIKKILFGGVKLMINELRQQIKNNIEDLYSMLDLMNTEEYKEDQELNKSYNELYNKTEELKNKLDELINNVN